MKPRLEPAPLTEDDFAIFARYPAGNFMIAYERGGRFAQSMRQDRRDADLIYQRMVAYGDIIRPSGYPRYRVWHAAFAFLDVPLPADYCVYD